MNQPASVRFLRCKPASLLSLAVALGFSVRPALAELRFRPPPTPLEVMRSSETVFAGTVVSSVPAWQHGSIFTTVRFSRLSFIKGAPSDTLQLVLEGGQVGTEGLLIDGQPEFEVGGRYIVFAVLEHSRVGFPVVACFRVRAAADGSRKVLNQYGCEASRVSAEHFTFVRPGSRGRLSRQEEEAIPLCDYDNDAPRLTDAEFLTAVAAACADSL